MINKNWIPDDAEQYLNPANIISVTSDIHTLLLYLLISDYVDYSLNKNGTNDGQYVQYVQYNDSQVICI